ncbi:MAG: glycine zipper 2TM domain-containing protein [Arenimonas sp.]|nr:glycine zipper 2TM domain-containing protein [Arenimonas sp.]
MNRNLRLFCFTCCLFINTTAFAATDIPEDCNRCGRITKIEKVSDAKSGVGGAVIGAVAGGLLGNQVGGGTGKTLATVAGAGGGAYAGKTIAEGNMEYQISVKMKDGSIQVVNQETISSLKVGDIVKVKNGKAKRYK